MIKEEQCVALEDMEDLALDMGSAFEQHPCCDGNQVWPDLLVRQTTQSTLEVRLARRRLRNFPYFTVLIRWQTDDDNDVC